ncbi:MAG: circadian clock protein KaiC [Salinivirgaceae bacterium]|nr:circadian clock protein KaiC [Salinivirgaceae bacterium]
MASKLKSSAPKLKSHDKISLVSGGVEKTPTGIRGFDAVLEGGLPKGRTLLITGSTGTGKTVFANEFLYRGIKDYNENGVYVTFEEHPADIIKNVRNFGWDLDSLIKEDKLVFVDASPDETINKEIGDYNLSGLIERIKYAIGKVDAKRIAIDSLSMLFAKFSDKDIVRQVIFNICDELKTLGITSVITSEKTSDTEISLLRTGVEEYVVDGVVELALIPGQQQFLRKMFIKKIRGVGYRSGMAEFDISNKGLEIFPKIEVDRIVSKTDFKNREMFGVKGVDDAMGGGIPQGHMVLISGNTGTGKTLFGMHFIVQGIRDGKNAVYVAMDEPVEQVKKTAREFGFDFDKYEREGKLIFVCPSLIDISNDKLLFQIVNAVNEVGANRVVIDSISSLQSATMDEEAVRQFLIQASGFFKNKGIACVMNYLSGANFGAAKGQLLAELETNLMRLSPIVDGIILLIFVERGQRVKRILNILKMRGSWHSNNIFQYEVNNNGILLGERYEE